MIDFADLLLGKRIAIVGNAKSLFDKNYGAEIDDHDVVIRFNKGFITKPESQGTKTDILILAIEMPEADIDRFNAKYVFNRCTLRRNKTRACWHFSLDDRKRLQKALGAKPSTGMLAIDLCMQYSPNVDLYGFDWGASPTFYNPEGYKTPHNYELEEGIVDTARLAGKLRIRK